MRILYPTLYRASELDVEQQRMEKKADLVKELLAALGFESPFDIKHRCSSIDLYESKLRNTTLFKDYANNIKLFSAGAKPHTANAFTSSARQSKANIGNAFKIVLSSVGLKLASETDSSWNPDKQNSKHAKRTYQLAAEQVGVMAELIKLKTRRSGDVVAANAHAHALLSGLQIVRFKNLLDHEARLEDAWRGGDGRHGML
jgi:hypothetical protein